MEKTVLVTGASRGIGKAIALAFAAKGYRLAINCVSNTDRLMEAKREAECLGVPCLALTADLGDPGQCVSMFDTIRSVYGSLDVLVNNAGISHVSLLQDMTFEEWEHVIASNLSSVFHCCKLSIPGMVQKQRGKIINISSVWGVCGASCEAAYSASKGGVNALTMALAKELAPSNIQVNAIACGAMDTEMNQFLSLEEKAALLEEIPAGRMGTPEEAARMALYLAEAPEYLTGQIIRLDGGWI